jgi:aminotransferase
MARYHFTDQPSRDLAVRLINEARGITVPGDSFGPGGKGHLQLSFDADANELNETLDRLERWLRSNYSEILA